MIDDDRQLPQRIEPLTPSFSRPSSSAGILTGAPVNSESGEVLVVAQSYSYHSRKSLSKTPPTNTVHVLCVPLHIKIEKERAILQLKHALLRVRYDECAGLSVDEEF